MGSVSPSISIGSGAKSVPIGTLPRDPLAVFPFAEELSVLVEQAKNRKVQIHMSMMISLQLYCRQYNRITPPMEKKRNVSIEVRQSDLNGGNTMAGFQVCIVNIQSLSTETVSGDVLYAIIRETGGSIALFVDISRFGCLAGCL